MIRHLVLAFVLLGLFVDGLRVHCGTPGSPPQTASAEESSLVSSSNGVPAVMAGSAGDAGHEPIMTEQMINDIMEIRSKFESPVASLEWLEEEETTAMFSQVLHSQLDQPGGRAKGPVLVPTTPGTQRFTTEPGFNDPWGSVYWLRQAAEELAAGGDHGLANRYRLLANSLDKLQSSMKD